MMRCTARFAPRVMSSFARMNAAQTRKFTLDFQPEEGTARCALEKSCYLKINFKISEDASVYDAIQRMAAHKIGALAVCSGPTDNGQVIGVISERDYLCKIALLGKTAKSTKVVEICTHGVANLVMSNQNDSVDLCMRKLINADCRHLLINDDRGVVIGMLSIKDLVKVVLARNLDVIEKLTNLAIGKGANYGSD